jgi:hypothetical protein
MIDCMHGADALVFGFDFTPSPTQAREEHARRGEDRTRAILVLAQRFMLDTAGTPYRLRIQLMTHSV